MNSRQAWPALLMSLLLVAGCGEQPAEDDVAGTMADTEDSDSDQEKDEEPAIPVETAYATRGDVYASYSGTAPIEAFQDATVIAKVGGEVRELLAEEGDSVTAGQVLARLDGERLRFEQMQTEANLRKLERDYERNVDLNERGLISEGDFEKLRYDMEALRAANDLAKLQLSYAEIRSPIDGVVSERFIKVGNTLQLDAPTFQVTSMEPLVSYLHIPEREYRNIGKDQPVAMFVDALEGEIFRGNVARISPIVDAGTGTFKITVEVSDETRRLKPGMFARLAIIYDTHANVLQVPRSALINEVGTSAIFIVDGDKVQKREVETGYTAEGNIEIVSGLEEQDQFVVVGQAALKDGSKIVVIGDEADAPSAATANAD